MIEVEIKHEIDEKKAIKLVVVGGAVAGVTAGTVVITYNIAKTGISKLVNKIKNK